MDCHLMVTADRSRIYEEREKKGESLIIVIEKLFKKYTLDLGIYIHISGTHNTIRKDYTLSNKIKYRYAQFLQKDFQPS